MKRTPVTPNIEQFPALFHPLLRSAAVYNSSCSQAKVYFIDRDGGFYLKTDACRDRFLDAYGRDWIEPEILGSIGAFEVFG